VRRLRNKVALDVGVSKINVDLDGLIWLENGFLHVFLDKDSHFRIAKIYKRLIEFTFRHCTQVFHLIICYLFVLVEEAKNHSLVNARNKGVLFLGKCWLQFYLSVMKKPL